MQEYELKVLEQYDINVKSTQKTRGAFFCETDQGLYLLTEANISEKRAGLLRLLGEQIREFGDGRIDTLLANREGKYISLLEDGKKYMVKKWYYGRECDPRKNRELLNGAKNLAKLHLVMQMPGEDIVQDGDLGKMYESHNRELRKIRQFIRKKALRDAFELEYLKSFEQLFRWAELALDQLNDSEYEALRQESQDKGTIIHGQYNYHNILVTDQGIVTTNFEGFRQGIQMEDLYYFLRKSMEKHGWDIFLWDGMVNAYSAVCPINAREMEYLKIRFLYPEKVWKVAATYYHSNKAWSAIKNIEKFRQSMEQSCRKEKLLESAFGLKFS